MANHEEEGCGQRICWKQFPWAQAGHPAGRRSRALPDSLAQTQRDQEFRGLGMQGLTYTEEEALVFLDGPQAAEEACHHDDGPDGNDQVGCRQ